jgi:hypothetical protein
MSDYKRHYTALHAQYTQLIEQVLANPATATEKVPQVMAVATQIANVLDEAAKDLALVPSPSQAIVAEQQELTQQLQRIQRDYSGLVQNTDKVETLRRIRSYQDESWRPTFAFHLIAFFVLVILLLLVIVFTRQRENTTTSPMSATMRPTLTY